jgi:hypothetical protein
VFVSVKSDRCRSQDRRYQVPPRHAILRTVEREDLAVALERHGTDAAAQVALALRAGAAFWVRPDPTQPARNYIDVWTWRARCLAEDDTVTCKDFDHGLPALQRAGDAPVALGRVDTAEGTHLVFLTKDLTSCVAVL